MFGVARAEEQGDRAPGSLSRDRHERVALGPQLAEVPATELGPPSGVVAEPLSQLMRGAEILHPRADAGVVLGETAGPQPVHQDALAIASFRSIVDALYLHHGWHASFMAINRRSRWRSRDARPAR